MGPWSEAQDPVEDREKPILLTRILVAIIGWLFRRRLSLGRGLLLMLPSGFVAGNHGLSSWLSRKLPLRGSLWVAPSKPLFSRLPRWCALVCVPGVIDEPQGDLATKRNLRIDHRVTNRGIPRRHGCCVVVAHATWPIMSVLLNSRKSASAAHGLLAGAGNARAISSSSDPSSSSGSGLISHSVFLASRSSLA
jgi:hypothetical protein